MKKNILKIFTVFSILISTVFFTGCPVSVSFNYNKNTDQLHYYFSTDAGSNINELISSFDKSTTGSNKDSTIFDTVEIERALFNMGLTNVHATTEKIQMQSETIENLTIEFNSTANKFSFINLIKDETGNAKQLLLTLSPEILQDLITNQNSIIQKYADLLMAPCFTNDAMTKEEYIELVASLYGNEIADEITSGEITLSLKNTAVKKMINRVTIPLIDILTLTSEKTFTVDF